MGNDGAGVDAIEPLEINRRNAPKDETKNTDDQARIWVAVVHRRIVTYDEGMNANDWLNRGRFETVKGRRLFVMEAGDASLPPLLLLHGYPTCSFDYHKALPILAEHFRVIIHDHLGFGFSDKPQDYSYSLVDQCDLALALWQQLGIKEGHVLAHDYGTSVATEMVARHNHGNLTFKPLSLTLCNGSMHVEMAKLRLIQKLLLNRWTGPGVARLSSKRTLKRNLKNIYFDAAKISDQEVDALWDMMTDNEGKAVLHQTTQYITERYRLWHRWIGALQQSQLPMHVLWAENDPVAVLPMAEVLSNEISNSSLTQIAQAGHFPMLEVPEVWSNAVLAYLLKA